MGRSYLGPPDKGIRQILFATREQGGGAIPFFVYNWPWLVAGSPDADQVSFISQTSSSRPPPTTIGSLWTFSSTVLGGGMYLSQTPRIMHGGPIIYAKRNQ